jgi:hypothetical protein
MQKLICGELVIGDDPFRICQVLPERVAIRAVYIFGVGVVAVVPVKQNEISNDLGPGNDIASPSRVSQFRRDLGTLERRCRGS